MESTIAIGGKSFNPLAFSSQKVATLVDEGNFLAWKQHVLLVIKTHRHHCYLDGIISVPSSTILDKSRSSIENPEFAQYEQQDAAISAWLLSTISPDLHNQLIRDSFSVAH